MTGGGSFSLAISLAVPVGHGVALAADEAERLRLAARLCGELGEHAEFTRVRVFGDVGREPGAHREVPELLRSGVDDLVRGLLPAGRAGDHVARADPMHGVADADLAGPLEDEEHLLV